MTAQARHYLQSELSRRCERNPRYSLRAFAKSLGVSHTVLSLVLAGKRPLSSKAALRIAAKLDLDETQKAAFLRHGDPGPKFQARQLDLDQFALIADWYHFAILSLLELPRSRFDAVWIGNRLGIAPSQAQAAMDRLVRLKLVARVGRRWKQTGQPLQFNNATQSTEATRRFHKQLLLKAAESIETDPAEARSFTSMTFAVDPGLLPYARDRIAEFRRALMLDLERRGSPKRVYQLSVLLFPLSQTENQENP